jgi:hypothetical protein
MAPNKTLPATHHLHPISPELWGGVIRLTPKTGSRGNELNNSTYGRAAKQTEVSGQEATAAWPPWILRFAPHDMIPVPGAKRLEKQNLFGSPEVEVFLKPNMHDYV